MDIIQTLCGVLFGGALLGWEAFCRLYAAKRGQERIARGEPYYMPWNPQGASKKDGAPGLHPSKPG